MKYLISSYNITNIHFNQHTNNAFQTSSHVTRAGRTGAGHVYRLYSSAFYDQHMELFPSPQICTTPLEDLLLQMKGLGIKDAEKFPFPTAPPAGSLQQATKVLLHIGALGIHREMAALDKRPPHMQWLMGNEAEYAPEHRITVLGKLLSQISVSPRLGKVAILAHRGGDRALFTHAINLIACMADVSPFAPRARQKHPDFGSDDEGSAGLYLFSIFGGLLLYSIDCCSPQSYSLYTHYPIFVITL